MLKQNSARLSSFAKISRPRLSRTVPRKRLFRLLDGAKDKPVVWISGPAGAGKTTLAAGWLDDKKFPCLWFQLDPGDSDLSTFFYYLGMAGKKAAPRIKQPLPLLTPEYLMDVPTFSRRYFEDLCSRVKPPFFIIFDNFQDVLAESAFSAVLASGMNSIPEGVQVVFLSRNDPPPPFSGLLAGNRMDIIGWNDLKLTQEESAEIVSLHVSEEPDGKTLDWMYGRTEGWAAGVVLLARAAKEDLIEPGKVDALPPEKVFDYFASELFAHTDEKVREFLVRTSVLPTMTPSVAEQLTGNSDAGSILDGLNRRNYFIYKRSQPSIAYQYHPLFRDFLRSRVTELFGKEGAARLQKQAAGLLEGSGQNEDATELLLDCGAADDATRLILRQAPSLISQGRWQTLQGWIESLPRHMVEGRPWLLYWMGVCRLPISPEESSKYFKQAFESFKPGKDPAGLFLSLSGMMDSIFYHFGNATEWDPLISMMEGLRRKIPEYPSPEVEAQVVLSMLYSVTMRQPRRPAAGYWESRGLSLAESISDIDKKANILCYIGLLRTFSGDLEGAAVMIETFRKAMRTSPAITPLTNLMLRDLEAYHAWVSVDFEKNREASDEGIAVADSSGVHLLDFYLAAHGAAGALSTGDPDRADALLKRAASSMGSGSSVWKDGYYHALSAWLCLLRKDLVLASWHTDRAVEFNDGSGYTLTMPIPHVLRAIVMHESGKADEADASMSRARKLCRAANVSQVEFGRILAEARIAFDRREESRGTDLLRRAMALGRERGYANTFFWSSSVMARLCAKALAAGIETEYVRNLVRRRNLIPDSTPCDCEQWPWPIKIN